MTAATAEADSLAWRLNPPLPPRPAHDLTLWRVARALRQNSLAAWPARAYRDLIVHRRFLGVDCWLVSEAEGVRHILRDRAENYTRPVTAQRLMRPGTGDGLLLAEGDDWKSQRRMMAPHLAPVEIERLIPKIQEAAAHAVTGLGERTEANLARVFEAAAIDTLGRCLFSTPLASRAERIGDLTRSYLGGPSRGNLFDFLAHRITDYGFAMVRRQRWSKRWFAEVDATIAARRAVNATGDLFAALEHGDPAGLRDQVATMLAAGYESTARALFWASYLLAQDEAAQDAVRAELEAKPPCEINSLADLKAWPRLNHVLQEAMRLYPPVSTLMRTAHEADDIAGAAIKPGALVIVCPWVLHRHERHWEAPDGFRPERFAGPRPVDGTYIPFGLGKRVCIGATLALTEAQLLLAHVLWRWRIALTDRRPVLPVAVATTVPDHEPRFSLTPVR